MGRKARFLRRGYEAQVFGTEFCCRKTEGRARRNPRPFLRVGRMGHHYLLAPSVRFGCCYSARMLRFVVLCPPLTPGRAERVFLVWASRGGRLPKRKRPG